MPYDTSAHYIKTDHSFSALPLSLSLLSLSFDILFNSFCVLLFSLFYIISLFSPLTSFPIPPPLTSSPIPSPSASYSRYLTLANFNFILANIFNTCQQTSLTGKLVKSSIDAYIPKHLYKAKVSERRIHP